MKHLKKFLESNGEPIDVYYDVEEFKNNISIPKRLEKRIQKKLDQLVEQFPTMEEADNMKIYWIQDEEDASIGFSNGLNELHALLRLSIAKRDPYLLAYYNDYYIYEEENIDDLKRSIESIKKEIERKKDILKFYQSII